MSADRAEGVFTADAELLDGEIKLTIWHSTDPGPMRRFAPVQVVRLDMMHGLELFGSLSLAMRAGLAPEVSDG